MSITSLLLGSGKTFGGKERNEDGASARGVTEALYHTVT